jgi:hypothetical protein
MDIIKLKIKIQTKDEFMSCLMSSKLLLNEIKIACEQRSGGEDKALMTIL